MPDGREGGSEVGVGVVTFESTGFCPWVGKPFRAFPEKTSIPTSYCVPAQMLGVVWSDCVNGFYLAVEVY